MDSLIPICFPDYEVDTETAVGRLPLGHAGIAMVKQGGLTYYFEYGRYDPARRGEVRKRTVPNVSVDAEGSPHPPSLSGVLRRISADARHGGRILGALARRERAFTGASTFAFQRLRENANPGREPYGLFGRNCMHFVRDAMVAGGFEVPSMIDPRPDSYIEELMDAFMPNLVWNARSGLSLAD